MHRNRYRLLARSIAIALCALIASGANRLAWGKGEQRAILALFLNLQPKGETLVLIRPSDVLVEVAALEASGVKGFAGKRETINNREYVSLQSLAPDIRYEVDVREAALRVSAEPRYLASTALDLNAYRPAPGTIYSRQPSFFLNYSVSLGNYGNPVTVLEPGLSLFGNSLLDATLIRNSDGSLLRSSTNLTIDDRSDLRRLVLGDSFVQQTDVLAGSAQFFGINFARNFSLDPYFIAYPQGTLSGTTTTPSTVNVYLNGVLVRSEPIAPGNFTLLNIPYRYGAGLAQVEVRDAFGNVQLISSPYYLNLQTLSQGVSQYNVSFGPVRKQVGASSWHFSDFIFSANYRYGLTETLTPGARIEAQSNVIDAGPRLTLSSSLGALSLEAAVSRAPASILSGGAVIPQPFGLPPVRLGFTRTTQQMIGYAAALNYLYVTQRLDLGTTLQYMTSHYANAGLTGDADRPTFLASLFTSLPISPRITIIPSFNHLHDRDNGDDNTMDLLAEISLTRRLFLTLTVSNEKRAGQRQRDVLSVVLSYPLGENTYAAGTFNHQTGGRSQVPNPDAETLQLQRPLPIGVGSGYVVSESTGQGQDRQLGQFQYRGEHGFYEFDLSRQKGKEATNLIFAGSLVSADGSGLLAGYPVSDGFAVIRAADIPNVKGFIYNQYAGTTSRRGDLMVGNLLSYFSNELEIDDHDIPINYRIDSNKVFVAPPFRGGALVDFPVQKIRGITGKLQVHVAGKTVVPRFGTFAMVARGKTFTSPVGRDGLFYIDSPPAGRFPASVDFEQGTCRFLIDIPPGKEAFVKLGTLTCEM